MFDYTVHLWHLKDHRLITLNVKANSLEAAKQTSLSMQPGCQHLISEQSLMVEEQTVRWGALVEDWHHKHLAALTFYVRKDHRHEMALEVLALAETYGKVIAVSIY